MVMGVFCNICNKKTEYESNHFSKYHLKKIHNISIKEYYDLYLKKYDSEGVCSDCGKLTTFRNIKYGYSKRCKYCGQRCIDKKKKISDSCKTRDYTISINKYKKTCIDKFGCDNASKNVLIKNKIRMVKEKNKTIVPLSDMSKFERYKLLVKMITNKWKKILYDNWDGLDFYSGQKLITNEQYIKSNKKLNKNRLQPTIDHIIPITKGFINNISYDVIGDIKNLCICSRYINSCKNNKDLKQFINKGVTLMAENGEKVDIKQIIQDLSNLKWEENDKSQMKAVQLLKGLALSEDPLSNTFMKKLSDISTSIAKSIISKPEEKSKDTNESYAVSYANNLLEGMNEMSAPIIKNQKVSETVSKASALL